ncbi:MAG: electron transport complex subunit E [Oscillospiraceae bacterium]|nr:electron transport complex subunit E [Oscillospiraceae bacterium]
MTLFKKLTKGIFKENPVFSLVLGTCPTLAVTTNAQNGIFMGIAATFVLICSNIVISAVKKLIPSKVRLPSYIVIIAGFVTIVSMIMQAFLPAAYEALGIFLPLIVVNCIILGRAELFASKNNVFDSALDGLAMGIGFTFSLLLIGSLREIIGNGSFFGMSLFGGFQPFPFLTTSSGGFLTFGVCMCLVSMISKKEIKSTGCGGCKLCEKGECQE